MKNPLLSWDNEKWQAVINCDKSYDGIFFYGVRTTGIFCRPSCRAKNPARENVVFFATVEQAIKKGFRPCKKCRPDLLVFEPEQDLVKQVKNIFDYKGHTYLELNKISKSLGVSTGHLIRLFKHYQGLTPVQYLTKLRINNAAELLIKSDMNILDIAYMSGFQSLSNFYRCFKKLTGYAPNEYRKSRGDL